MRSLVLTRHQNYMKSALESGTEPLAQVAHSGSENGGGPPTEAPVSVYIYADIYGMRGSTCSNRRRNRRNAETRTEGEFEGREDKPGTVWGMLL